MKLLTIKELSQLIKVKKTTLYSWAAQGLIPSFKLNGLLRFDSEEIEKWIKKSKIAPNKLSLSKRKNRSQNIDIIVNNAIEGAKREEYNSMDRKPGFNQGLRKEV